MSDLISRKALLEAHQDLVAFGTDTTFAVRNLITNAPPQQQEQDKLVKKAVKDALEKAAKICEKMQKNENNTHIGERCSYGTCQIQGSTFAKAIRALIEKE